MSARSTRAHRALGMACALALVGCSAGEFQGQEAPPLRSRLGAWAPAEIALASSLAAADAGERAPRVSGLEKPSATVPVAPARPSAWSSGALGVEFGAYSFRKDSFNDWFGDAPYVGIRYGIELTLNTAISLSVGYFRFPTEVVDGEDVEGVPLRLQLELGSYLGPTQSRWYLAAGGGYNVCEKRPSEGMEDLWPALPTIESEWFSQAVAGFEFRNSTRIVARVELGHVWMVDSGADMWTSTGAVSYQF